MILGTIAGSFLRAAAGAIALTAVSGCSLIFVEGPPRDHASRHFFDCTSSMLAPGIDATLTGVMALGVLGVASDASHTSSDIAVQSGLVVGALASATYGYLQVSKCRQAKDDLGERLINMPYLGVPPADASRAPPPPNAARGTPPPPTGAGAPPDAAAPRDLWLSEGPPPPLSTGRREPMPSPPPYLRVAPPPAPAVSPPPAAGATSAPPPPPPAAEPTPAPPPSRATDSESPE